MVNLISEPERDTEGRAKAKKRKTNKSASCPFYKQGPMENFRDLALVCQCLCVSASLNDVIILYLDLYRLKYRTLSNWYPLVGNWELALTMEYAMLYQLLRSVCYVYIELLAM